MFPPQLPRVLVEWLTSPGDSVFDPFSGRGTVGFEALLTGRRALCSDANPLAVALSRAKVRIPANLEVRSRLQRLQSSYEPIAYTEAVAETPPEIRMLYSDGTLRQILHLKAELRASRADNFIRALVLGMLHANHSKAGATRGFSISMPNTFAMGANYVRRYIEAHDLVPPEVDVFAMLRARVEKLGLPLKAVDGGEALEADATVARATTAPPARLLLTSPPYLQVIKYGKYNWVRLWFLGHEWRDVDVHLTATSSVTRYAEFMKSTLVAAESRLAEDARIALVIGDVRRKDRSINLAEIVSREVADPMGWSTLGIVNDEIPVDHKVSRIWKGNAGRATKTDRILILGRDADAELPEMPKMDWLKPVVIPLGAK